MTNGLERGLDVMEFLAEHGEAKLIDFAERLDVSRATAFRVLATLQRRGYVDHVRAEHVYRLGPQMRALAARSGSSSVIRLAALAMADLRALTGETVNLALLRRGTIAYVAIFEGIHSLRMSAKVGDEVPAHSTAIGKAILAMLPKVERDGLLGAEPYPAYTKRTITRRRQLDLDLARTVQRGFAIDDEESEVGAACLAAPILGSDGYPLGSISVSGLAARIPVRARPQLGETVRTRCAEITAALADSTEPIETIEEVGHGG
ncbi:MAG: IclR family transcriptional regulator [Actinomycetota bacterium]|nr:IclR family transcriptional regulator [Actinomycetota bacterium]